MKTGSRLEPWAVIAAFVALATLLCLVVANGWVDPAIQGMLR